MIKIIIDGCPPYDGEYELDSDDPNFTNGELRKIKKETGIIASELGQAIVAGDQDAWVGVTMILLERSGKFATVVPDLLWNAPASAIRIDEAGDADDDDAGAEGNAPTPTEPGAPSASDDEKPTSGAASPEPLGGQVVTLPPTGTQL